MADSSGHWQQVYALASAQPQQTDAIESVSMISLQTGWFITYRGIYKTLDGGLNWRPASEPVASKSGGGFRSVFFRDENHGWLAGGEFRPRLANEPIVNNAISGDRKEISVASIWQTADGGATWQAKQLKRLVGRFTDMEFWNDIGVAFGDAGCVFTNDNGEKWKDMAGVIPREEQTGERPVTTGAYFVDHNNGWIFTSWFENLLTHDGGKTWAIVSSQVIGQNLNSEEIVPSNVVFADKKSGLLVAGLGDTRKLFKTSDGAKTWFEISANETFYDVSLVGGDKGFVLGEKGIYSLSLKQLNR